MTIVRVCIILTVAVGVLPAGYVVEWSAPLSYSLATVYTSNRVARYDVNGDSVPDVFVSDSSALKIYSGVSHNLIWTIPIPGYDYIGFPYIGNSDGDVNQELVLSAYRYSYPNYSGRFYVFDCQSHNQEYACPEKSGYPSVAVGDVDGDDKNEVCLVSGAAGSRILEVYGSTDIGMNEPEGTAPLDAGAASFPNPTWGPVHLSLNPEMKAGSLVTITDVGGRVVRRLVSSNARTVTWDCRDESGLGVPAGVYLYTCGPASGKVEVR